MNFANLESSLEKLFDQVLLKIPSIAVGIVILIIGRLVIRFTLSMIDRRFERRGVDASIQDFIKSILRFALYALLILTVANTMGIQTTSFIAVMSAFGLAVGMALQGSLSNFAGGVLILLFRPFDVGDYIASDNGSSGTVERIDLLYSTIIDDEGIRVFSPNGSLANSVIKNYSKILSRRMQFSFMITYETDIKQARTAVLQLLASDERIQTSPNPVVVVDQLNETGITLTVRAWAKREIYWDVRNEMAERITAILGDERVSFPVNMVKIVNDQDSGRQA
ncbi:MAG TPA: mechanosensitive ion channel [Candidatus Sphingobacterium stercorigallinarum]|nr:mechanosensitive ion channel [Candidatus Sphingobacterium stercorigallinarum]